MIQSIEFKDENKLPFNYITFEDDDENFVMPHKKIEFKRGVNILIGANGSGKSTIVKLLKHYTLVNNNKGYSDYDVISNMNNTNGEYFTDLSRTIFNDGAIVKADYRYKSYSLVDDSNEHNYDACGSIENFLGTYNRLNSSSGQNVAKKIDRLFRTMFSGESPELCKDHLTYLDPTVVEHVDKYINDNTVHDDMNITVFMDEVDAHLDINMCEQIYSILSQEREDTQIIAVIHNIGLINKLSKCKNINWIEMTPNYLKKVKKFNS